MRIRSDAKLVELARRGSRDAAAELFARHWRAAWRAAYVVTGRRELADDVAQDAFERAFAALWRFDERRPFGPWLHRIVVNRCLDLLRTERRLVAGEAELARLEWHDVSVGAGAAALAATGNLRVDIGARQKPARPVPTLLSVPPGSHGLALVAGGKLWLATRNGLRIEGMPVSAAELSPRALYAVVGLGSSLVALAPGNRRPWVHPTGGRVAAAS